MNLSDDLEVILSQPATTDEDLEDMEDNEEDEEAPETDWNANPGIGATSAPTQASREVRWLPPMTLTHLFEQCKVVGMAASWSTFRRCYRQSWRRSLKVRQESSHSKCHTCTRTRLSFSCLCRKPSHQGIPQIYHF